MNIAKGGMFKHRQKQFMVLYLTGLLSKVIACSIAMWSLDLIFDLENKEELGVVNKEEIVSMLWKWKKPFISIVHFPLDFSSSTREIRSFFFIANKFLSSLHKWHLNQNLSFIHFSYTERILFKPPNWYAIELSVHLVVLFGFIGIFPTYSPFLGITDPYLCFLKIRPLISSMEQPCSLLNPSGCKFWSYLNFMPFIHSKFLWSWQTVSHGKGA